MMGENGDQLNDLTQEEWKEKYWITVACASIGFTYNKCRSRRLSARQGRAEITQTAISRSIPETVGGERR